MSSWSTSRAVGRSGGRSTRDRSAIAAAVRSPRRTRSGSLCTLVRVAAGSRIGHSGAVNDSRVVPEEGWYPDPAGSARLRFWDGSQWTVHYADPPRTRPTTTEFWKARLTAWRLAVGVGWVLTVAVGAGLAVVDRPQFADVVADAWVALAVSSIPAVVLAIVGIRTPVTFVATAVASCAWSVVAGWSTMRSTGSTAAVGVLFTPVFAMIVVAIGCGIDAAWCVLQRTA